MITEINKEGRAIYDPIVALLKLKMDLFLNPLLHY
jgi:hypothetical protein